MFNRELILSVLTLSLIFSLSTPLLAQAAGPSSVNLRSAGDFVILAKSGISTTGSTLIKGDIGVSPAAATFITGFGLSMTTANTYSTTPIVVGKVYASDYTNPTPSILTTAINDMQTAYTDAAGRTNPTATELGAGNIGGLTIAPGLYKWGTGVTIPTDVTLAGGSNDVWIFQIAQTLDISSATKINLSGGAKASNIFWVVAGQVTIGTTAEFSGNILGKTAIVLNTGAKLTGRALAQTAVTLDNNAVTNPSGSSVPTPTPTSASTPTQTPSSSSSNTQSNSSSNSSSTNNTETNNPSVTSIPPQTPTVVTQNPIDTGCVSGNKFSATTGSVCVSNSTNAGCVSGNRFSATTGQVCVPTIGNIAPNASATFGQQVRSIAMNLQKGSNNNDVATLQLFLISQNKGNAAITLSTVGATGYFGELTRSALAEFQANVGINPALGNFGPITRGYLSTHY